MPLDQMILRRFEELDTFAATIEQGKYNSGMSSTPDAVDSGKAHQWATSVMSLIERSCGADSVHARNFQKKLDDFRGYIYEFKDCRGVFGAAYDDYKGGFLFQLRAIIDAEVCTDVLDQAETLLAANYKDAACVIAGCALETSLVELCKQRQLALGKLDVMNASLCKAGAYNMGMQKTITAWADKRNCAAHGKWDQFGEKDVRDLIDGVRRFIAEKM